MQTEALESGIGLPVEREDLLEAAPIEPAHEFAQVAHCNEGKRRLLVAFAASGAGHVLTPSSPRWSLRDGRWIWESFAYDLCWELVLYSGRSRGGLQEKDGD